MTLTTPEGVHAVQLGTDFVFLDVARDEYRCVLAGDRATAARRGDEATLDPGQHAALIDAGLLVAVAGPVGPRLRRGATRDLPPANARRPGAEDWRRFIVATARAAWHLRGVSLGPALAAARSLPARAPADPAAIAGAVAMFDELSLWLPRPRLCLARSLGLRFYLDALGIAADWTFGVHLFPFRAHCWLEAGDHVVGDARHRTLAYAPIMTIAGAVR